MEFINEHQERTIIDVLTSVLNDETPVVDSEGNEKFVTITVKVPTGDRSGEPYDGYGEAESYRMHIEKRAREKAETAAKNAAKAKRDAEYRAKQKANREKANKEKAISKG